MEHVEKTTTNAPVHTLQVDVLVVTQGGAVHQKCQVGNHFSAKEQSVSNH